MPDTEVRTRESTRTISPPPASAALSCANCGTPLTGPYCANCGQHVADFHRSVWRFVADFFDNTICWDNKLLRTLGPLFKQPGFLTQEFMIGRRVRYVHPLRLFLFTSAVCLTLLQFSHDNLFHIEAGNDQPNRKHGVYAHIGPLSKATPAATALPASPTPSTAGGPAAGAKLKSEDDGDEPVDADAIRARVNSAVSDALDKKQATEIKGVESAIEARVARAGGPDKFSNALREGIQQKLSWVALGLLPVFALGLRAVFWRKDSYYFAHLIFSLHYHTYLLLFWTGYTGLVAVTAFLPFSSFLSGLARFALLWPPVYLYVSLRRMYADGPKRTAVKVALLGSLHLLAIVIGVAAVGAMAFFSTGK